MLAATTTTAAGDVQAVPGAGLIGRLGGPGGATGDPAGSMPAGLADHVAMHATSRRHSGSRRVLTSSCPVPSPCLRRTTPEAAEVVAGLRAGGYQVTMLTGDNHATACRPGGPSRRRQVHAGCAARGQRLIWSHSCGLGSHRSATQVRDARLAAADLGIAMGAMGTDVAIEIADVA